MPDPMPPDLTGTVTLATGTSGGIGAGITWRFAINKSGGRAVADLTQGHEDLTDPRFHA